MKTLNDFVNEGKNELSTVIDKFVDNIVSKKLIEDKKDVKIIHDKSDSTKVSEIQISLDKITVDNADKVIALANKYPAFKNNVDNASIDNKSDSLRLLFVNESLEVVNEAAYNVHRKGIRVDFVNNADVEKVVMGDIATEFADLAKKIEKKHQFNIADIRVFIM